ncbi:GNAT family N-acetyltransferase [Campylobacter sp. 2018MI35]|uniref:GNAT family N-acetyltransferase n=1 Tax=Campylobacter sp. 2018MI34 TaxID=2800582 RepID=UPI001907017D|nr:GNAT family N-acetyltransferase [Campylobacter sp. 2018MI34]MBK1991837.1 GNAT family N-acetyltransferase [Campylobacter sp. 2018MI34]
MIRKAKKEEARKVIILLAKAMDDMIYHLSGCNDYDQAINTLCKFYEKENNRLSYKNIYIYELNKEILAALCCYDGALADELDKPLNENLNPLNKKVLKECENEFYLDSISVEEKARGRGIAKELIEYAYKKALEKNKKLSLIVEEHNKKAKSLYEKMGFKTIKVKTLYGHIYNYMEK